MIASVRSLGFHHSRQWPASAGLPSSASVLSLDFVVLSLDFVCCIIVAILVDGRCPPVLLRRHRRRRPASAGLRLSSASFLRRPASTGLLRLSSDFLRRPASTGLPSSTSSPTASVRWSSFVDIVADGQHPFAGLGFAIVVGGQRPLGFPLPASDPFVRWASLPALSLDLVASASLAGLDCQRLPRWTWLPALPSLDFLMLALFSPGMLPALASLDFFDAGTCLPDLLPALPSLDFFPALSRWAYLLSCRFQAGAYFL